MVMKCMISLAKILPMKYNGKSLSEYRELMHIIYFIHFLDLCLRSCILAML